MKMILLLQMMIFATNVEAMQFKSCQSTPLMDTNFFSQKSAYFYQSLIIQNNQIELTLNLYELKDYQSEFQFQTLKGTWLGQSQQSLLHSQSTNRDLFKKIKTIGHYQLSTAPVLELELVLNDLKVSEGKVEFIVFQLKFRDLKLPQEKQLIGDLTLFDRIQCLQ